MKVTKALDADLQEYFPTLVDQIKTLLENNTPATPGTATVFGQASHERKLDAIAALLSNHTREVELDPWQGGVITAVTVQKLSIAYHTGLNKWSVLSRHRSLLEDWA